MARVNFTMQRVTQELQCEVGKSQSLHQDATTPGLGLRVTAGGARSFIFEARLNGKTVRVTIGDVANWKLDKARTEAARLKVLVDGGTDPREERATKAAAHAARQSEAVRKTVTLADGWAAYCADKSKEWSALSIRDHNAVAQAGGVPYKRGKRVTEPGPLWPLMPLKLVDIDAETVSDWLAAESAVRPARTRLAFGLLRGFATWAKKKPKYHGLVSPDAVDIELAKHLPESGTRDDCLMKEQLPAFFGEVRKLSNPTMSTYLIGLLVTGARKEELAELKWTDIDFQWGRMHLKDKIESDGRTIPLTPFFASLLAELKLRNSTPPNVKQLHGKTIGKPWQPSEFVFSSTSSADGKLTGTNKALSKISALAGIQHMTLHGLRRSFATLSEWCELPTGVVAQIMGHKASAIAEKHYIRRPIDLLKHHHEKFEAWILEQAGIQFAPAAEQKPLGLAV